VPGEKGDKFSDVLFTLELEERKYFTLVLDDNQEFVCKFIDSDQYSLRVETETAELLVPKHSVKYIVLKQLEEEG